MTAILEKVLKGTLEKSDSQKAFSPWWEDLQDKLVYSLLIFGMIAFPFNMISNTPVECTPDLTYTENSTRAFSRNQFNSNYLRKFCTLNSISEQMVFLPIILILAPLPLVAIGELFLSFFKVEKMMNSFYKLLVKESLDREDVEAMEKENIKDCHEIRQMFHNSNGIYYSFLCRTFVQMVLGTGIGFVLLRILLFELSGTDINCEVFGIRYTCVVPLANFYWTIVLLSCIATAVYMLCVIYNLLWLMIPSVSPLHDLMIKVKAEVDTKRENTKNNTPNQSTEENAPLQDGLISVEENAPLHGGPDFVGKSKDLQLLITLLGMKHGVAEALRLLSVFDKKFQELWIPGEVKAYIDSKNKQDVHIEWSNAPIAKLCNSYRGWAGRMYIEYTLEIVPNSKEPIKSKKYIPGPESELNFKETFKSVKFPQATEPTKNICTCLYSGFGSNANKSNLDDRKECDVKIIISTEVNGRTIAQRTEKVLQSPVIVPKDQPTSSNGIDNTANTNEEQLSTRMSTVIVQETCC